MMMGFRFQLAAELLLRRMGYRILKAEQDLDLRKSAKAFSGIVNTSTLGDYLCNYSDYITVKNGRVFIVEVKSLPYGRLKVRGKWETLDAGAVSFTQKQIENFFKSGIPVLVLLIAYNSHDDLGRLGPAYFKMVPFEEFQFGDGSTSGFPPNKTAGRSRLTSRETYSLLRKAGALTVTEVGPGYIRREQRPAMRKLARRTPASPVRSPPNERNGSISLSHFQSP